MSPVKKYSSLGRPYFIHDQNHRRAAVDEPDKYVRPISGYIEVIIGNSHVREKPPPAGNPPLGSPIGRSKQEQP